MPCIAPMDPYIAYEAEMFPIDWISTNPAHSVLYAQRPELLQQFSVIDVVKESLDININYKMKI